MFRLAGLITAELAGERRFYSEKEAETRFLSQLLLFINKKVWGRRWIRLYWKQSRFHHLLLHHVRVRFLSFGLCRHL
ncbi:hypothetical protein CUM67_10540 [Enterococcus faecium]|nr:hypothetical protein CUM67_10540 [Enterococcus faecium]